MAILAVKEGVMPEKTTPTEVGYERAHSQDESCNECIHYLGGACELVAGAISADYWCRLFAELRGA